MTGLLKTCADCALQYVGSRCPNCGGGEYTFAWPNTATTSLKEVTNGDLRMEVRRVTRVVDRQGHRPRTTDHVNASRLSNRGREV